MTKARLIFKKVVVIAICLVCSVTLVAQETETGVEIGGVIWATRNVDVPNTFSATPQDAGMFYQWNRTVAFSITDPMVSIGGSWADVASSAAEWESENNVCPTGWCIPTKEEFEKLIDEGGEWVTVPANGYRFGSGANTVFFPAAGERFYDGTLVEGSTDGLWGGYWASDLRSASQPYLCAFDESDAWISYFNGREGYNVRCVKGNTVGVNDVSIEIENANVTGYFDILGKKLKEEPKQGLYFIRYDNGTTKKVMKQQ